MSHGVLRRYSVSWIEMQEFLEKQKRVALSKEDSFTLLCRRLVGLSRNDPLVDRTGQGCVTARLQKFDISFKETGLKKTKKECTLPKS